ncbi:hypothetical protein [Cellulomonas endophytica]|uniref:hypothetical protein n=1 Tax=Cellulomonas endophytica TaxID=2494735 RepID=UPI0010117396|nr:hypothetical protein [Cellulomonas endophytica]
MRTRVTGAAVAATGTWTDPDGVRMPAGEVHAWERGTNATVCGLQLGRQGLLRFPHVTWEDAQPARGRDADAVTGACRRCAAGTGARRDERPWRRTDPRP